MTHVSGHIVVRPFKLRRDTSDNWAEANPILADGEPGFDKTSRRLKIGDGVTVWNSLTFLTADQSLPDGPITDEALLAHVESEAPHPVYDDGPSLLLLYENAKV